MTVYVFGNTDEPEDQVALEAMNFLRGKIPGVEFKIVSPNQDLPEESDLVLMDVVREIREIGVIRDIKKIIVSPRGTVHDFDLGFQLKYLQKIGKLQKVTVVGIPENHKINYHRLQSILRKLVAQDMQGS